MNANLVPPLLGKELPAFVRDMLGSAPKVGEGVDSWLFRTARLLHPYRDEAEIVALLEAATHGERIRAGAIERAVQNSKTAQWVPGAPVSPNSCAAKWPVTNADLRDRIISEGPTAAEFCEASPVFFEPGVDGNVGEILETLFSTEAKPDPLLCIGKRNSQFATRPLSTWYASGKLTDSTLIVPSPMTAHTGRTKEGGVSEHTLENTGPRRFLVVEFDRGGTDDHAALLWHLAEFAPLCMAVHSGGKSLHGWFYCQGQGEDRLRRFMDYAVSIGGDRATWTRSQFVRLPDGRRENGARLPVFFFDPEAIKRAGGNHE